jgi:hypothetical protein
LLTLNLPPYKADIREKEGKLYIFDPIRMKSLRLSPEEWVRQHFVNFLIEYKKIPRTLISLELGQKYLELQKRCDIVVWDREKKPLLIVECKAPHIAIDKNTLFQAGVYNHVLKAARIILTNGLVHWSLEGDKISEIEDINQFELINSSFI